MAKQFFESFNQKQIEKYRVETGIDISNIESLRTNQSPFELHAKAETKEISEGAVFEQGSIELGNDAFTNFYDLSFRAENPAITPQIFSADHIASLKRILVNNEKVIGAINAGFFYLVDEGAQMPIDPTYNLCIRKHSIVGLPTSDRPLLYTSGSQLGAKDVQARGIIALGSNEYKWSGARTKRSVNVQENHITLYNSACCTIRHIQSDETGSKRILDEKLNFTPKDSNVFDVVVQADNQGLLRIKDVVGGGNTNFFAGNFILHFKEGDISRLRIGDLVQPLTLGDIDLAEIDSAVSIGLCALAKKTKSSFLVVAI